MKRTLITSFLVVLVAWSGLGGCTVFSRLREPGIEPPTLKVGKVHVVDHTPEGVRVQLTVVLGNPNPVAIPLVTNSYRVTVAGKTFAFVDAVKRTLPARGHQRLTLSAALATGSTDMSGAVCRVTGAVEYRPPGQLRRILTDSGMSLPNVVYSTSGKLGRLPGRSNR